MVNLFQLGLSAGQFWTQSGLDPSASGGGWRNPKLTIGINWSSRFWVWVGASRLQKYAKYCRKLQSVARNCIFLPESTNFAKNCWDLVEFYPLDLAWFFRIWPDFLYSCSRVWVAQVLGKQTCPSTCLHQFLESITCCRLIGASVQAEIMLTSGSLVSFSGSNWV